MADKAILRLREKLGFSQEDLAQALGVQGRLTVYRWEVGDREPSELIRRLILLLHDMPEREAKKLLHRIQEYGRQK